MIWLATFIVGTANDYIFMLLPVVDNFWQAQERREDGNGQRRLWRKAVLLTAIVSSIIWGTYPVSYSLVCHLRHCVCRDYFFHEEFTPRFAKPCHIHLISTRVCSQAVIMLTPRMPLYIPCVYNAFMCPTLPDVIVCMTVSTLRILYTANRVVAI